MGMSETKKQKKSCLDYTRVWMTIIAFGYLVLYRLFQLTTITDVNVFIGYVYFTAAVGVLLSIIDLLRLRCCPKVFKSKKILAILTLGLAIIGYTAIIIRIFLNAGTLTVEQTVFPLALALFIFNAVNLVLSYCDIPIGVLIFEAIAFVLVLVALFLTGAAQTDLVLLAIIAFVLSGVFELICCDGIKLGKCDYLYYLTIGLALVIALLLAIIFFFIITTAPAEVGEPEAAKAAGESVKGSPESLVEKSD